VKIATLSNASVGHTRRWVEWFRARGHDVRVWSLEAGPAELGAERLPALPLPGAIRYPLAVPALRRALDRFAPDVVDAHYVPNYGMMGVLAGRHPLSVSAWGSDLLIAGPRNLFQRARARVVLSQADAVIADARNLGAAAERLGAPPARVHVIPWGVDRARFAPGPVRDDALLVSTRMHELVYDIETVLDGLAPLFARRSDLRLVVAGDGARRAALEARAARALPAGRCTFTGRRAPEALSELLGRAGLALSASRSDSTSVSLLESMAAGAVPVVSDIEGNREWVAEGDGARTFVPGDPTSLGAAVERALDDPAWCAAARARNARMIAERGDAGVNMERIETLFRSLAPGGAR